MSRPIFKYRLSPSVLSLTAEEKNNNYHQLERLKCHESHDPFVLYLQLNKSGKELKEIIPKIEKYHLVQYLVVEKNYGQDERR